MIQNINELIVQSAASDAQAIESELLKLGALGLWTEDDETRNAAALHAPLFRSQIRAFFDDAKTHATTESLEQLAKSHSLIFEWHPYVQEDWVKRFQKEWSTFSPAEGVWIVPSWDRATFQKPSDDAVVIEMDPGMAFGTGHHETTALCTRAIVHYMKSHPARDTKVLDVGTGTGLLAILALKLGGKSAVGTDIDDEALQVALENAVKNGINEQLELRNCPPQACGNDFNLVVANILSEPLIEMATQIAGTICSGGTLFLSGILRTQELAVREAYAAAGLRWKNTIVENEWVLIHLDK